MLNWKKLFLRINSANLTKSLVGIFEEVCSSNLLFNAKILSLCGMLGYRPTTSVVTRKESSGIFPIVFMLSIKSPESQMYDQPLCIKGFKWKSRNSDAFSVGVPQLEITHLPGTLWSRLWILGNRYKKKQPT